MSGFIYEKNSENIVTITMDMEGSVNSMSEKFLPLFNDHVTRLEDEKGLAGVVLTSAKSTFFAGGDLNMLSKVTRENAEHFFNGIENMKAAMRRLEKLPVPVVAAINGSALGGGLELALTCNHRIAWCHKSVQLGFPEVTLGLLPGGGGIVKTVYLLGLLASNEYLVEGKRVGTDKALADGLIDSVVKKKEELIDAAKDWIRNNKDNSAVAVQPWDTKDYAIPGGTASDPQVAQMIQIGVPMLTQKTRGLLPAPEKIFDVAVQTLRVDFDTAMRIESRGLTALAMTPQAKNLINTLFFQMNQIKSGASRPADISPQPVRKLGVLGAGMMGQGIAYVSALSGISVILKDTSQEVAENGKAYSELQLKKRVDRNQMTTDEMTAVLSRIYPTDMDNDLDSCDLIIEAVFENMELKHEMIRRFESRLSEGGVWGSNTSTLPISRLAAASESAENLVGIHFFSPVKKMPLVEIIMGKKTSDAALAKAFDYAKQIGKTPIVVNDSLGFFTSRTFGTYLDEGVRLLVEGVNPIRIDNLAKALGMPVGPLAVYDEVSLELSRKAKETWEKMGLALDGDDSSVTEMVVNTMIGTYGRGGRYHGGGFYDYKKDGSKKIWSGLTELYGKAEPKVTDDDVKDRMLFRQVIEALKCLEDGVLRSVADGNIGSIMGIGAPVWTGGLLQFVNTFGLDNFVKRCQQLSDSYGVRFKAPKIVFEKLSQGETFV